MKIEPISVERKYSGDIVMIADIVRGRIFKRRERVTFFGRMIENGSPFRSRTWAIVHPYAALADDWLGHEAESVATSAVYESFRKGQLAETVAAYERTLETPDDPR